MAANALFLGRARSLLRLPCRRMSASPFLSPDPQLHDPSFSTPFPLPPSPSAGSPFYHENWRNPNPSLGHSFAPAITGNAIATRVAAFSNTLDAAGLMNVFADWMTSQKWSEMKQLFEFWIRSLDASGRPNRPDANLYNHYLRANLMMGASPGELLDLVGQMQEFEVAPNTAAYNLVLKGMYQAGENEAAVKLIDRMLLTGFLPDDESYNLVIGLLISVNQLDSALRYLDLALKSGFTVTMSVFTDCVWKCVTAGRLDVLSLMIEKCKTTEQNKALCPPWNLCNYIADVALQADNGKLALFALEFFARWIARGESARMAVLLSVNEGLVVAAFGTAGRTFDSKLLDAAWSIMRRSLRQQRAANPETFLSKIYAHSSLGNLQRAFSTLNEFETAYGSSEDFDNEMLSPFTSLYPLVIACSKNGFSTLDSVYGQLENLSRADPPFKSVAALNCVILGCANIWDLDRAYETFKAIGDFGLTADIHSYNALICAFGKVKKTSEASKVFEHLVSLGVKPNAKTYALLADAHLINRDQKAAISLIEEMVDLGFTPPKEILKKARRRCSREFDFDTDEQVESLCRKLKFRLGNEARREMLYNLEYSTEY